MKVLAAYNLKGGVGKTSTAVALAHLAARDGARTLLWDLDPQGAATFCFRIRPRIKGGAKALIDGKRSPSRLIRGSDFDHLDLLPADFSFRKMDRTLERAKKPSRRLAELLQPLAAEYDFLFLDCAPSISRVSAGVFVAADALLVPTIPTTLSLNTLTLLRRHLKSKRRKPVLLPFFCMVDRRRSLHRSLTAMAGDPAWGFLNSTIPYSSVVEQMAPRREPLAAFAPNSAAAVAYEALWDEVLARLGERETR